jgi:hypothetical protein
MNGPASRRQPASLPPALVASASVSVPMPSGALGVRLAWWIALLSLIGLLAINARYLRLLARLAKRE